MPECLSYQDQMKQTVYMLPSGPLIDRLPTIYKTLLRKLLIGSIYAI